MTRSRTLIFLLIAAFLSILSHPVVLGGWKLPDLGFLAFVSYVPLFWVVLHKNESKIFGKVFFFAFLFYLGTLYWLYNALHGYGHLDPAISILVLLILACILATYLSVIFVFSRFVEKRLSIPVFWTLPVFWVALEWCRTQWPLGGFPWAQAGYSQWKNLNLIQISDLFAVYGVTALLIWANLGIFEFIRSFQNKCFSKISVVKIIFVFLLLGLSLVYGSKRKSGIENISKNSPHFSLALLQGNIPQDEKWLSEEAENILKIYQKMTREAFSQKEKAVQLVIWPEASFPYEIALDQPKDFEYVGSFEGDILVGSVSYENKGRLPPATLYTPIDYPVYNSALLIKPGAQFSGAYFKHHLVPYGEYIPLKEILPFIGKLTGQMGEFVRGTEYNLLKSGNAAMGILICYEDIFPSIAQTLTRNGANLLVNITNDAWYGDSSALPQHLSFSTFRAIENRRSLVRATNTGMTASFDAAGNIWGLLPSFEQRILYDQVPLLTVPSFYSQHGDIFAYTCIAFSGLLIVLSLIGRHPGLEPGSHLH